jgi:integrase
MSTWKSTGCRRRNDAVGRVLEVLKEWEPPAAPGPRGGRLRDFIEPYCDWKRCPRIAERLADGKRISRQHAARQRHLIEGYVLKDPIADLPLGKISRGDVKDFKARMVAKHGTCRRVNSILTVLKTVFRDGVDRKILERDSSAGVGKGVYEKREAGVFIAAELAALFPEDGPGHWQDLQDHTAFLIAAICGLRRGELLALRWKDIDFEEKTLRVERAWRSATELGDPKWGQIRDVPLPVRTLEKLKELRASSLHVLPEGFVLHDVDGSPRRETWFTQRLHAAMFKAKIKRISRGLKPRSFRHSLNTLLLQWGVDPEKVRAAVGWSNSGTQRGYTHHGLEHLRGQAELIDRILI